MNAEKEEKYWKMFLGFVVLFVVGILLFFLAGNFFAGNDVSGAQKVIPSYICSKDFLKIC